MGAGTDDSSSLPANSSWPADLATGRLLQFGEQLRRYAMVNTVQQIEQLFGAGFGGFVLRVDPTVALLQLGQEALAVVRVGTLLLQRIMWIDKFILFVCGGFDHEVVGHIAQKVAFHKTEHRSYGLTRFGFKL